MTGGHFRNLCWWENWNLNDWFRVVPRCDCWQRRPRWTVLRHMLLRWQCVDCGKYGKLRPSVARLES